MTKAERGVAVLLQVELPQHLDGLQHLQPRDNRVGGGDSWDDVSGDRLDVKLGLGRDSKHIRAQVRRCRHKVQRQGVVLVKLWRTGTV